MIGRICLINLDEDAERLAEMRAEFARVGLFFERIPAVRGADMPAWLEPYFRSADGCLPPAMTAGEIGCYASHLVAWRRILEGDTPWGLVCEDDVKFHDDAQEAIERAALVAPEGWDVIRLSAPTRRAVLKVADLVSPYALVRYSKIPLLTGGYLVSKQGARKLLRVTRRQQPVDMDIGRPWLFGLDEYGVWPRPMGQRTQADGDSAIDRIEQRHFPRRRRGLLGMPARVFGGDRWSRLSYNMRTIGPIRFAAMWIGAPARAPLP